MPEKKKHYKEAYPQKCMNSFWTLAKLQLNLMLIFTKGNQTSTLVNVSAIRYFIAIFKNKANGSLVHAHVVGLI